MIISGRICSGLAAALSIGYLSLLARAVDGALLSSHGHGLSASALLPAHHSRGDSAPEVLVITVPHRAQSEERMQRLGSQLRGLGLSFAVVEGPNMERYCPKDINDYAQSKAAGKRLLLGEWHGRMPDLSSYDLALFQVATLVGHLRAWQHVASSGKAAVVLEDDATITSGEVLRSEVRVAATQGADVSLLDPRHCQSSRPPHMEATASGMTGYWLDAKAARAFLANFPVNIPIDWGVNKVLNEKVVAVCSAHGPAREWGGERYARTHSSFSSCGRRSSALGFLQVSAAPDPVAYFLQALLGN